MKLPSHVHADRPWRIHEFTRDFRVEDVWALPTPGGLSDFPRLVEGMTSLDPTEISSFTVRTLFEIRSKLGEWLRLDRPEKGVGARVQSLHDRLPADLRETPRPDFKTLPFSSLYLLDQEFAAESANETMHGLIHLGWVPDGSSEGGYRGELAIYVKPNGLLGEAYMTAIKPFRYTLVYPTVMREIDRNWRLERAASA
jgi:hypothetical protein